MIDDPKGPAKAQKEPSKKDNQTTHNNFLPSEKIREILNQEHSLQSIEELQDNFDRIPRAFKKEVIDYLSDALKEYGKTSAYGKKIENFLRSILPSGSEIIRKINVAITSKDHENTIERQVSFFDADKHYEQCEMGFASVAESGDVEIIDHFRTGNYTANKRSEIVYVPLINDSVRTGQITLPEKPEKCEGILDVIKKIESKIDRWIYISPEELPIFRVQLRIAVASWFLFAYDDPKIQERVAGLLGIVGTSGGGKKRFLTLLRQIAYRPIYLLNTNKIPSVFRLADPWGHPTLLIDEADQRETGSEAEWVQFVNSRYDGTPIPRFNTVTGSSDIFRSFGLTALALRRMPKDEGTTGRMLKINATISPVELPEVAGKDIYDDFQAIRGQLFYLRLKYYKKLKFIGRSGLPVDQSWRGKEALTLLRLMEQIDQGVSGDIVEISRAITEREIQNLSQTWDGLIINEIHAFISDEKAAHEKRQLGHYYYSTWIDKEGKEHKSYLNLKYLADRLGTSASDIQRSMAQFKISTYERFRPEGSTKAQRGILMFAFPSDTDRVFMRYVPGYVHELLELERAQKTLPKERDGDSKISESDNRSVPPVPLVPPHDIPNDFFNNNNNSNMHVHVAGTSGTSGTKEEHENDPETIKNLSNSAIQSERKRWNLNPKLELFNLVEKFAPKSKYYSLTAKAIHDMIAMYGIDLSTIHDLCEELNKEGAVQKTDAGGYYINKVFLEGGDYK